MGVIGVHASTVLLMQTGMDQRGAVGGFQENIGAGVEAFPMGFRFSFLWIVQLW